MSVLVVAGTDTEVGKTLVSAALLKNGAEKKKQIAYFKPVQTGTIEADDTKEVKRLTGLGEKYFFSPCYTFPEPLAPCVAAQIWKQEISFSKIQERVSSYMAQVSGLILELAGGLMVPWSETLLQIEVVQWLVQKFGGQVLLVARDRLGVINQALLSLWVLRSFQIPTLGVVLNLGHGQEDRLKNSWCIERFSQTPVLARVLQKKDYVLAFSELRRALSKIDI